MTRPCYTTDIAVFGGGIAGLFLFHGLNKKGFHCLLLDPCPLGSGQTVHSQGIIHGGMKYALTGALNTEAEAIRQMPAQWKALVSGTNDHDLSAIQVLSDHQWMWSSGGLSTKVTTFFASKALRGTIHPLKPPQFPDFFKTPYFKGNVYEMADWVLDVPSVVTALSKPFANQCYQMVPTDRGTLQRDKSGAIEAVVLSDSSGNLFELKAQHYIFCSGKGNEHWLDQLQWTTPQSQRRPLQMVMMKAKSLPAIFAHGIGIGTKPTITITTHPHPDGSSVWYIGGNIAEEGVTRTESEQIDAAKQELSQLFPWFECPSTGWGTLHIDRAEPKQKNLTKPDAAFSYTQNNVTIAWPTKLALAPNLYGQVVNHDQLNSVKPQATHAPLPLRQNTIAKPLWESL